MSGSHARGAQGGVALAIVLWFVAGMAILVAGVVAQARTDVRMAQLHVAKARATALGDGAINLALAELAQLSNGETVPRGLARFVVGDSDIFVRVQPVSGLIDLNRVDENLMQTLLADYARLPGGEARQLAGNLQYWRSGEGRGGKRRFESTEDLLRVPGFNRAEYDAIRDVVTASGRGSSPTRWENAPVALQSLATDAGRDVRRGNRRALSEDELLMDGPFRIDALVKIGEETWLRRRWYSTGVVNDSVLPYRPTRIEPPRVVRDDELAL